MDGRVWKWAVPVLLVFNCAGTFVLLVVRVDFGTMFFICLLSAAIGWVTAVLMYLAAVLAIRGQGDCHDCCGGA